MRYANVSIASFGYQLPPRVVTSEALEDSLAPLYTRLKLRPGRLELMSGVRERRFWEQGQPPSAASVRSAREAIERAGLTPDRIQALVHTSVCRDYLEPATASIVAGELGLARDAFVFDLSNACLGFLNGLLTVANLIELGQIEAAVVVATEDGAPLVEATIRDLLAQAEEPVLDRKAIKPAFASLTIGSGSVAAVVTKSSLGPATRPLLGGVVRQSTEHSHLCRSAPDRGFADPQAAPLMETDSEAMLHAGCALAAETWGALKDELGWSQTSPSRVFTHQVGSAHRRLLFGSLGLDEALDYPTLPTWGNVGSVSLPLSLALAADAGALAPGDTLALLGIGSGLNCVMLGATWA
ncbi:MAG: 3-oxoacyl-ACP synthase III [Planctomycetes bacterium]|nr:3-oxoacyl-ACP synthase III [Planctomycetota bacterium]